MLKKYDKILPKILEKIASEGKEKYLPENTPIFMQLIVKDLELLKDNRHPLPNTKAYPYRQRLYNWAKAEPGRLICLFYVGSGLNVAQKQQMEDLEKLRPNIRVIDFNTLDLKEFDFNFKHPTLGETSISNYYKNLYSMPKDQRIAFGSEIDLMRVLILLKACEALDHFQNSLKKLKIVNSSDQIEPQAEAFSPISIFVCDNFKSFKITFSTTNLLLISS